MQDHTDLDFESAAHALCMSILIKTRETGERADSQEGPLPC